MVWKQLISELLTFGTLIAAIALVLFLAFVAKNKSGKGVLGQIKNYVKKNSIQLALVVSLVATLGSLFYSNIMGYDPCQLCWFQRIFMYPLPIILAVAWEYRDKGVKKFVIPLAIIGPAISVFHYVQQIIEKSVGCDVGSAVDCSVKYTFDYAFITIPMMALVAFLWVLVFMVLTENGQGKKPEEKGNGDSGEDGKEEENKVHVKSDSEE
ncbi:MAG: disulfide bond formation protein B [Candidatus Pacearchaeota archaeon]